MIKPSKLYALYQKRIIFIVFVIIIIELEAKCPSKTSSDNPRFQIEPLKAISGIDEQHISFDCCLDGYITLRWFFRKPNVHQWVDKGSRRVPQDDNRTLVLTRPIKNFDTGYYLCVGMDGQGSNLSASIFVYFLNVDQTKYIQSINPDVSPPTRFRPGTAVNLSCAGFTYEPRDPVLVTWRFTKGNKVSHIPRGYVITTLVTTIDNRTGDTNPDLVDVESYLFNPSVNLADTGEYSCAMEQGAVSFKTHFQVLVVDDSINWRLLLSLMMAAVVIVILCILAWAYHYDIIVFYKSYLDPCPKGCEREIDVSIMYGDTDGESLQIASKVVHVLEKNGFRCWLYDRNKTYGRDMFEDYRHVRKQSYVMLSLLSSKSGSYLTNISTFTPDPGTRRIYLFIPDLKSLKGPFMELGGGTMKWLQQELQYQTCVQQNSVDWSVLTSSKGPYHRLLVWILASMPSGAIRDAKRRTLDNVEKHTC